jgi:hypothetical protein
MQTSLDFEAKARAADPQTSHDAAARVDVAGSHAIVSDYLARQSSPLTSAEIVAGIGERCSDGRIRGALVELCRLGSVRVSDTDGRSAKGNPCSRYELVR